MYDVFELGSLFQSAEQQYGECMPKTMESSRRAAHRLNVLCAYTMRTVRAV